MSANPGESRVQGLSCPSCGGALEVAAGLRVVECPYCETPLLASSEIGIRRWAVEPKIGAERAREVAGKWLGTGWRRDRRLRDQARQGEAMLAFLPFFRMQADVVGFALGTEERRRTVGSGKNRRTETYEVDVERSIEQSFDRTYPALDVAEWGVQRIDLRRDHLVPYQPESLRRLGMVFSPTGSEVKVKQLARQLMAARSDPGRGLKRVRFKFVETLRERFSVIYYPLWIIRYRFENRSYQILVDGEDGALVYGKAPGNDLYRAFMMVVSQAAALFLATTIVQAIGVSFGGVAVVGVGVFAALMWGWKHFRHGGVVVEGTGVGGGDMHSPEWLSQIPMTAEVEAMVGDLMQGRLPRGGML
jgi:hypothetical protein